MPKKLFGVSFENAEVELEEKILLEELNKLPEYEQNKLTESKMQRYFLNKKGSNNWTEDEKKLDEKNGEKLDDSAMSSVRTDIQRVELSLRGKSEQKKEDNAAEKEKIEENKDERNNNLEEKFDAKTNEVEANKTENGNEKIESNQKESEFENKVDQKAEDKKIAEKSDKEEEKKENPSVEAQKTESTSAETEKKETDKKEADKKEAEPKTTEKFNAKEDLEIAADKFAKNVEGVQAQQAEMADAKKEISEERMQAFFKDLIDRAMMMQKGQLPKEQVPAYMQDMEALRELNKKQNGGIEEQLMQQRADNLQEIGEEYQKNREVTPKLVKKMDSLDAIDNILTGITRHPKLLFISLLLMGLNPLMAIGMAVMAAFGKSMVQDIYHNLPTAERAQLDQTQPQAQDQQASRDAQTEAYRKGVADAKKQMNEQIEKLRQQNVMDMRSSLLNMKRKYEMALLATLQREKEQMEKALAEKAAEASQKNADVKTKSAEVEKNPAEKTKAKESEKKETVGKKKDDNGKERSEKKNSMVLEDDEKMLKRTRTKTMSMSMSM